MTQKEGLGPEGAGAWIAAAPHRAWLARDARRQLAFFEGCLGAGSGFRMLGPTGAPLDDTLQELHSTTRLVHSYALAQVWGYPGAARLVTRGLDYLRSHHHDGAQGGYLWALREDGIADDRKLAYGHVFVLLAAASAMMAGHGQAEDLLWDAADVLDRRFWEEPHGRLADEWNRDWTPFSNYRGMNANMHGVEALLGAFEATGEAEFLNRAGRILDAFTARIAPAEGWRLPEHYTADWQIDRDYAGDPMFRPAGTTPGHSFELGRLILQHWDLSGRPQGDAPARARRLVERAQDDAWLPEGGLAYTLDFNGEVAIRSRFWWPVTEAIGALAALLKIAPDADLESWYRRLWLFADGHFIDHDHGGWFPEVDPQGQVTSTIFKGKPDIYHALQACLYPLCPGLSRHMDDLRRDDGGAAG